MGTAPFSPMYNIAIIAKVTDCERRLKRRLLQKMYGALKRFMA